MACSVDVTFRDEFTASLVLENHVVQIDGNNATAMRPNDVRTFITIHYLPFEIGNECVFKELENYGQVLEVRHQFFKESINIVNGNRIVVINLNRNVSSFIKIAGF